MHRIATATRAAATIDAFSTSSALSRRLRSSDAAILSETNRQRGASKRRVTAMHSHGDLTLLRILAISGSLRQTSSNTALVQAASELAPDGVEVRVYTQLAELPPF